MWVSRDEYGRLKALEAVVLRDAVTIATSKATIDWMRVRLNQVEAERGELLSRLTGMRPMVPVIARTDEQAVPQNRPIEPAAPAGSILDGLSSLFEDVGDEMAQKIGAGHDEFGALQFRK